MKLSPKKKGFDQQNPEVNFTFHWKLSATATVSSFPFGVITNGTPPVLELRSSQLPFGPGKIREFLEERGALKQSTRTLKNIPHFLATPNLFGLNRPYCVTCRNSKSHFGPVLFSLVVHMTIWLTAGQPDRRPVPGISGL